MKAELSADGKIIVVTIPWEPKKRGGNKRIIAPAGMAETPPRNETLARLVGKAHRWLKLLESGQYSSIKALAEKEQVDNSYLAKVLNLTLLAPDIVTAIIDGRQPDILTWDELRKPFPMLWSEQRAKWGMPEPV